MVLLLLRFGLGSLVVRIEPKALHMLSQDSTPELHPQPCPAFRVMFEQAGMLYKWKV